MGFEGNWSSGVDDMCYKVGLVEGEGFLGVGYAL